MLQLVRLLAEAVRQVLGDELDVVPAEPGAVDLGAEHVLEPAPGEARIDAGGLPVDDVLARRRLAGRAAERGGERAGDDLHALPAWPAGWPRRRRRWDRRRPRSTKTSFLPITPPKRSLMRSRMIS